MASYADVYRRSLEDPDGFWGEAARAIDWDAPPTEMLDASRAPLYRWFPDGRLNTCFNAVDRHVAAGRGDQPAIIHDSPVTDSKTVITYAELQDQVARFAGGLTSIGMSHFAPRVADVAIVFATLAFLVAIKMLFFFHRDIR